jgi:uncharacterized membrane protein YphA (DoxX/SURF4 family)
MKQRAQRGCGFIVFLILNLCTGWEWVVSTMYHLFYSLERIPFPVLEEAVLAPSPVWTDVENGNC